MHTFVTKHHTEIESWILCGNLYPYKSGTTCIFAILLNWFIFLPISSSLYIFCLQPFTWGLHTTFYHCYYARKIFLFVELTRTWLSKFFFFIKWMSIATLELFFQLRYFGVFAQWHVTTPCVELWHLGRTWLLIFLLFWFAPSRWLGLFPNLPLAADIRLNCLRESDWQIY